jgi:hypothetical protein
MLCGYRQVEEAAPAVRQQLQETRAALQDLSLSEEKYEQLKEVGRCTAMPDLWLWPQPASASTCTICCRAMQLNVNISHVILLTVRHHLDAGLQHQTSARCLS